MTAVHVILVALAVWLSGNSPPNAPVITEPAVDGRVLNPEDVHMETGPFSDPDPGDTHAATDWEIWTVSPQQRVWAALGATGLSAVHIHLGDGVFQGSHAGRSSLVASTNFMLRARHKDSSGDPGSEWSPYSARLFSTGQLTSVFPMELDDVTDTPTPQWRTTVGATVVLPGGASPSGLRLESGQEELLLGITGAGGGQNAIQNPPALMDHVPARVRVIAGGQPLALGATDLRFTDHEGVDRTILLPEIALSAGQSAYYWVSANGSTYVGTSSQTQPSFSVLARGAAVPWEVLQPGFKVEVVASGFQLPVNIAFVPDPGMQPGSPLFYVTELYGKIKVVRRNGTVGTYAQDLLNFNPTGVFPGSGEQGVAGIVVEPGTGDVIATYLYDANGPHYPKVVRFRSTDGGQTASSQTTILDMPGELQGQSHQISSISIGPDGKFYVHMGDGFTSATAQNLDSFRGKILRLNPDGSAPGDNPFYNAGNGINSRDYVYAYGFRNPFGGTWRAADGRLYEIENGPEVDRLAQVTAGRNYLWDGSDASMRNFAIYNWEEGVGPVNIAFIQPQTFAGSGFPASKMGHLFLTESGATWGTGPQVIGKKIQEFVLDAAGNRVGGPTPLIAYNGSGKATCVGLAAGPDGLYFTDLYKDQGYQSPIDAGASVLRIRYVGEADFAADVTTGPAPLPVQFTDLSTVPNPETWHWTFGDGGTSTDQNPSHVYTQDGVYSVRLSVAGPAGAQVRQRNAYIRVGQTSRIAVIGGSSPPGPADAAVAGHLAAAGFIVDAFDDEPGNRPSAQELAEEYGLVIVSSTVASANIGAEFRGEPVPLVFWEQALLQPTREALAQGGSVIGSSTAIDIAPLPHPVTQGYPVGGLQAFQSGQPMSVATGTIAPGASVLARRSGSADAAVLAAEQGAALLGGHVAPARRAFLFFEDAGFLDATPEARDLLKRAACWAGGFAPAIGTQPQPQTVIEGEPASFSVQVAGAGPMTFQWRRNGVALTGGGRISGATTAVLTIDPAIPGDSGSYDALVGAPCGQVTSAAAALTVTCYANCDRSAVPPVLNVSDFICFQARYAAGDPYANCDGSTTPPVLNVSDFVCFQSRYAQGCQ